LLTPGQAEHLSNEHYSHSQRVVKLLQYIQKKGLQGYRRFLQAVEKETTHIGHKELYTILAKSNPSKYLSYYTNMQTESNMVEGKGKTH